MGTLSQVADYLIDQGVSASTHKSYNLALTKLSTFRSSHYLSDTWPVPLIDLLNFIAWLSIQGLTGGTISSCVSGISYYHKINGFNDTTKCFVVSKALEGIKRIQGGKRVDSRAPISLELLSKIVTSLEKVCNNKYESNLFSAVFSLAFHGLLRIGEITSTSKEYNCSGLRLADVTIKNSTIELTVNWSKTDQRGKTTKLMIAANGTNYCPVKLITQYLNHRPPSTNNDLFIHLNSLPLTRYQFNSVLEKSLNFLEIPGHYKSHSFRIGGATELARIGTPDEVIMKMGRWKSHVYSRYIRLNFV